MTNLCVFYYYYYQPVYFGTLSLISFLVLNTSFIVVIYCYSLLFASSPSAKANKQTHKPKDENSQVHLGCNQPEWAELWLPAAGGPFSSCALCPSSALHRAPTGSWTLAGPRWPRCRAAPPGQRNKENVQNAQKKRTNAFGNN